MTDVFISYARSTAKQAQAVAEALRGRGYSVWIDDDLPAHRTYSRVIEEQMTAAKAAVVIWSADAVRSEWVLSEANRAREDRKLVQVTTDKSRLPMPFDTIQCADLTGWDGSTEAAGWRKVVASIADLIGGSATTSSPAAGAPLPLPSKPSIAALPFANLSGDPEQEYFADGMLVEIVEALSKVRSIFVIAGGSSLALKGRGLSPQEAGRALGVRYVLEGSIRKAGGRVRIGVQLIDASDGAQIWTHRFEDTLEDIFTLQDRVALSVAGKIGAEVTEAEIRRASARPTENMGSYDLYLRAMPPFRTFSKSGILEALGLLDRAVALDPEFGTALSLAASCHRFITTYQWSDDPEANRRQGMEMARRALKAAGDDASVLASVAVATLILDRNQEAAIATVDRALELNSGLSYVWFISGVVRLRAGDADLAVEHIETSMRLDPMGGNRPSQMGFLGTARFHQGRFREAVGPLTEWTQRTDSPNAAAFLAAAYGHLGQSAAALEALARYRSFSEQPVEKFAETVILDPGQRKEFLDGIALAEGRRPSEPVGEAGQP